jgi:hypothetical protein
MIMKNVQREALRIFAKTGRPYQTLRSSVAEITEQEAMEFFHFEVVRSKCVMAFNQPDVGGTDADISDSAQSLQDSA